MSDLYGSLRDAEAAFYSPSLAWDSADCSDCSGEGFRPNDDCAHCKGEGWIKTHPDHIGYDACNCVTDCPTCEGSGQLSVKDAYRTLRERFEEVR